MTPSARTSIAVGIALVVVFGATLLRRRPPADGPPGPTPRPGAPGIQQEPDPRARGFPAPPPVIPDDGSIRRCLERLGAGGAARTEALAELHHGLYDLVGRNGDRAVPLLEKILTDPALFAEFRQKAIVVLQAHPRPAFLTLYARLLIDGTVVADGAAETLRLLGGGLGRIDPEARSPALVEAARRTYARYAADGDPERRAAAVSFAREMLQPPGAAALLAEWSARFAADTAPAVWTAVASALLRDPDGVVGNETLAGDMLRWTEQGQDEARRVSALRIAAGTRVPAARRAIAALISDPAPFVAQTAMHLAGEAGLAEAVPSLAALLRDPGAASGSRPEYAVRALSRIPSDDAVRALLSTASGGGADPLRQLAFKGLAAHPGLKSEALAPDLLRFYEEAPAGPARELAVDMLAASAGQAALARLSSDYAGAPPLLRQSIAEALLSSPQGPAFGALHLPALLQTPAGPRAVEVLAREDAARAAAALERVLTAADAASIPKASRLAVARRMDAGASESARRILKRLAESDPDEDVREAAQDSLARDP